MGRPTCLGAELRNGLGFVHTRHSNTNACCTSLNGRLTTQYAINAHATAHISTVTAAMAPVSMQATVNSKWTTAVKCYVSVEHFTDSMSWEGCGRQGEHRQSRAGIMHDDSAVIAV